MCDCACECFLSSVYADVNFKVGKHLIKKAKYFIYLLFMERKRIKKKNYLI